MRTDQAETERISKAAIGRRFRLKLHGDRDRNYVVGAACALNEGHWYCLTHGEGFANQIQKDGHIHRGRHELVWVCHHHGPEVP